MDSPTPPPRPARRPRGVEKSATLKPKAASPAAAQASSSTGASALKASRSLFNFQFTSRKAVTPEKVEEKQADAFDADSAREAALREVAGVLAVPENFAKLNKVRYEYEAQRASVEVQISLLTGRQAEEARSGLGLVAKCKDRVEKVKVIRKKLEEVIESSSEALPEYPLIRAVFIARRNLLKTMQELESIIEMPLELKRIEQQLESVGGQDARDTDEILPAVHKSLIQLERRQQAALYSARNSPEKRKALEEQLANLDDFFKRVALRATQIVKNCTVEAMERPAVLVKVLQMVERQEVADARVRKAQSGAGTGSELDVSMSKVRGWYGKMVMTIEEYCEAKFEMLCGTLVEEGEPVDVPLLVSEHQKIIDEIVTVKDLVEPCFPPKYQIFNLIVRTYHAPLVELVNRLMYSNASVLSTRDIIDVINWLRDYHGQLEGLDCPPEAASPVLTEDLDQLLQGYNFQTESMMRNWVSRILEDDLSVPPESAVDGKLYTIAPIDLFKMIDQQFEVADALEMEKSMYSLAMVVANVLDDYRAAVLDVVSRLWHQLQLEHICAQVNNSGRCVDCCMELLNTLEDKISEDLLDNIELQNVADGFTEIGKVGAEGLAKIIVADLIPVLQRFFAFKWYVGEDRVAECVANTILDYTDEIKDYLLESYYRKVLVNTLERVVLVLIAQLLEIKKHEGAMISIDADFSAGLEEDYQIIIQCFLDAGLPERMLNPRVKPLQVIRELLELQLTSENVNASAELASNWYRQILGEYPDLPMDTVSRLIKRKADLDSKTIRTILSACNEVYKAHRAEEGDARSEKSFFSDVYHEMGVKPAPYSATEGMFSNFLSAVSKRTRKPPGDAEGTRPGRLNRQSQERTGPRGPGAKPTGCYAVDIRARLFVR